MKKILFQIILLLFLVKQNYAQVWQWAKVYDEKTNLDEFGDAVIDSLGNIYLLANPREGQHMWVSYNSEGKLLTDKELYQGEIKGVERDSRGKMFLLGYSDQYEYYIEKKTGKICTEDEVETKLNVLYDDLSDEEFESLYEESLDDYSIFISEVSPKGLTSNLRFFIGDAEELSIEYFRIITDKNRNDIVLFADLKARSFFTIGKDTFRSGEKFCKYLLQ